MACSTSPEPGWVYSRGWFAEFVRKGLPVVMIGALLFVIFLWGAGLIYRQRFLGIDGRVTAFLVSSLVIGPGLIVNTLLKENWGRGRPNDMAVFGGEFPYAPPGMIVDQCVSNCSFTSGHGALGFWAVAFAFLVPKRHRAEAHRRGAGLWSDGEFRAHHSGRALPVRHHMVGSDRVDDDLGASPSHSWQAITGGVP